MTSKNSIVYENKNINEEKNIKENFNQSYLNSINVKSLLIKLFQKHLDSSLSKLESKSLQDFSNLKLIKKNFDDFSKKLNNFHKKVEETLKKREKEKINKTSKRNDKKIDSSNKKRTLSSNANKISFNKRCKTIMNEEDIDKINNTIKNFHNEERGKSICTNNLGLRTISNFRTEHIKEKEREKEKEKQNEKKIEIDYLKKQKKDYKGMNLNKYKTSVNKSSLKKDNINQNENLNINNIKETNEKKNNISWTHNYITKNSNIPKWGNYSFDKVDGITNNSIIGLDTSLSYIDEKIEKKSNKNDIIRKNNFKNKEENEKNLLNKIQKQENKNINHINNTNINLQNNLNNDNSKNIKKVIGGFTDISKTIYIDKEKKFSKTINNSTNINNNNDKKDNKIISVENIVKLVDDVNQNINKILVGSQSYFQKRNTSIRNSNKSFAYDKKFGLKEYLSNISPEISIMEIEKDKIKNYNDNPNSNINKEKNLIIKCKINKNIFTNQNNAKKLYKKIKINKDIIKNNFSMKNIRNEKQIKHYNYESNNNKNNNSIKKIIFQVNNYTNKENEKNNNDWIDNQNILYSNKTKNLNGLIKKNYTNLNISNEKDEKNIKITFVNMIEDNQKILSTILQYLSFKNKINFLSINKYFLKERISLLINKKEELVLILQLKENETIDDKIKKLKSISNTKGNLYNKLKDFKLSKDSINNLKLLNNFQYIKLFKENHINNNKITEINIIYKLLLLFMGEKNLVEISDDNIFWKNCCKYFLGKSDEGKIGNYIISQAKNFCFDHRTINLIEFMLIGNKNNIINGYYEKLCKTTGLIIPLIKQALEYCGVIFTDKKNNINKVLENLQYNQILINKLDSIINCYHRK